MFNYPKGSEWRKWDLQIHTPGTKLADNYRSEGDVWEKFLALLRDSDVSVFGICDYFSIDGYLTLLEKLKSHEDLNQKVFLPNIEIRLNIAANKKDEEIHLHLIFDNRCDVSKIQNFLSKLKTENTKANGTNYLCTSEDLSELGYDTASVAISTLNSTLRDCFGSEKPYLIAGACSGYGGLRADNKSPRKMRLSDEVDKLCDFFIGRPDNREYFLQEDRYEDKTDRSVSKAVVTTSDCHSLDECSQYLGKQSINEGKIVREITWIKADPNFEGLKQILYEPSERVAFGYEKPETKKPYFRIDSVRYIDNTGEGNFPPDLIEINSNLTSIVGGKSTGKSLLLYYIAKTIDRQEAQNRLTEHSDALEYNFDDATNFDFEVKWADGQSMYLKNITKPEAERKILYIPQNYLNKLSEKNVKSRDTLNKFVRDVLLQDELVQDKYDVEMSKVKEYSKAISVSVTKLFQSKHDVTEAEEALKQLGEEKGIIKYLEQLQREAEEIKASSGLGGTELQDYEGLLAIEKECGSRISVLTEDKKSIRRFRERLLKQIEGMEELRKEQEEYIGDQEIKTGFIKELGNFKVIETAVLSSIDKVIGVIDEIINSKKKELDEVKKKLGPFMAKVKLQDELIKKNEAIKAEREKLDKISLEKKNLEAKKGQVDKEQKLLVESYRNILAVYNTLKNEFKKYENNFDDISLNVSIGFNDDGFSNDVISGCLNKQDLKRIVDGVEWKEEFDYKFEPKTHLPFVENVFRNVLDGKIKTLKGKHPKDVIIKLLEDYFELDFRISYKNDSLDKMSPGKKGLVLLRLLIDLSNEEWPILLDQPEDDLDNRSVYDDLVSFVKTKKRERQIIIVTHNPNLVVGADAEEIIVANQEGQEIGRENKKYKFEYVSGSLENSFELPETHEKAILFRKGIRQHVCEILEGGKEAFKKREQKYSFS